MGPRKLLIAEGTEDLRIALAEELASVYHIRVCAEGMETLAQLRIFRPELLILDLMLPGLDGISLVQTAVEEGVKPVILATTRFVNEYVMEAVDNLGIDYIMVKPCDVRAVAARLSDLSQRVQAYQDPESYTATLLMILGISTKVKGYGYMREAIVRMYRDPNQQITKELYPAVAEKFGFEADHVERDIRSAIQTAWKRRNEQLWRMYFQPDAEGILRRPTNGEFITRLAERLTARNPAGQEES